LAKSLGIRTLSLVRRPDLIAELKVLGADEVLLDEDASLPAAHAAMGNHPAMLAGNAVGGDSALRLMDLLGAGGSFVTYGAMSRRSLKVPNKLLIFKDLHLHGLWITNWLEHATQDELFDLLHPLAAMIQAGTLHTPVDAVFTMDQASAAMTRAKEGGRAGKVMLRLSSQT
jgi:NADPH:quinone reductase-like Zn-dependent oxidoreductase